MTTQPTEDKKYLFGYTNLKWFIREIIYTFSNRPSFFSRKRIENFVLFSNAIFLLDMYYMKAYHELSTTEALLIFAANLGYAGFQTGQIRKDQKENIETGVNQESSEPK